MHVREIYVRGGQRNNQDRMEEEANLLYRRPQMTGQTMEEEDERSISTSYSWFAMSSRRRSAIVAHKLGHIDVKAS